MKTFQPDLIIEVTRACDRKCRGCYAPNTVIAKSSIDSIATLNGMFLCPKKLRMTLAALNPISTPINSIAIRGGEPTLHPQIAKITEISREFGVNIFIETHGRWAETIDSISPHIDFLKACEKSQATLKISFDTMHAISVPSLAAIAHNIEQFQVKMAIAITEDSKELAMKQKDLLPFIPRENFYFQKKAKSQSELVQPVLGTINTLGMAQNHLTSKFAINNQEQRI
jgi:organic radical activating enzyme